MKPKVAAAKRNEIRWKDKSRKKSKARREKIFSCNFHLNFLEAKTDGSNVFNLFPFFPPPAKHSAREKRKVVFLEKSSTRNFYYISQLFLPSELLTPQAKQTKVDLTFSALNFVWLFHASDAQVARHRLKLFQVHQRWWHFVLSLKSLSTGNAFLPSVIMRTEIFFHSIRLLSAETFSSHFLSFAVFIMWCGSNENKR